MDLNRHVIHHILVPPSLGLSSIPRRGECYPFSPVIHHAGNPGSFDLMASYDVASISRVTLGVDGATPGAGAHAAQHSVPGPRPAAGWAAYTLLATSLDAVQLKQERLVQDVCG
jgi:hypothetical protein